MPTTEILEAWRAAHPPLPEGLQLSEEEAGKNVNSVHKVGELTHWYQITSRSSAYRLPGRRLILPPRCINCSLVTICSDSGE